jgi:hypothetical protein
MEAPIAQHVSEEEIVASMKMGKPTTNMMPLTREGTQRIVVMIAVR